MIRVKLHARRSPSVNRFGGIRSEESSAGRRQSPRRASCGGPPTSARSSAGHRVAGFGTGTDEGTTVRITVLAGGVGGARFLRGLLAAEPDADVTVIGNTGDDLTLFGLRICPDLDTVMYTLGGGIHEEQGWGRSDETWSVKAELAAYGAEPTWFGLGDRDIATHVVRTQMLDAGYPLSAVTAALCERWKPGITLLPMSDQRVETHVVVDEPSGP